MCSGWWFMVSRQNRWSSASVTVFAGQCCRRALLELLEVAAVGMRCRGGLADARVPCHAVLVGGGAVIGRRSMRNPRYFAPLALGAPDPPLEIPVTPSRMIHFFDPCNEKMVAKLPEMAHRADILLGNLEDAIPADRKEAAREGLVRVGRESTSASVAVDARELARLAVGAGRPDAAFSARSATGSTS